MDVCKYCLDAAVDPELDPEFDFSAFEVGTMGLNYRIMFCSGVGRAPCLEIEKLEPEHCTSDQLVWKTLGFYTPRFCPECGRPFDCYKNSRK